jgi:hypothetical protein
VSADEVIEEMIGDSCTLPMPHRTDVSRRTVDMGHYRTLALVKVRFAHRKRTSDAHAGF